MIAEIVGVAGTGKSTITKIISKGSSAIQTAYHLNRFHVLLAYYSRVLFVLPTYLVRYRGKGQVLWSALRWMTYLEKSHQILSRLDNDSRVLLDQGPVYWFTYLHTYGSDGIKDEWFTWWWTRELENWASILDVVFYLDCNDTILIERIRNRNKMHRIKNMSDVEACEFLARYREGYQHVIAKLTTKDQVRLCYLSTDRESPERIADQILIELLVE